jgi:SAM-dependent methyltransferase
MSDSSAPQDRPAFPAEAVSWLVGTEPCTVVSIAHHDLATALSVAGHHVASVPTPEKLPFGERSIDVIVATTRLPDLDVVADLLRPGGRLALVSSRRDHRIPWARKLDQLMGSSVPEDPAAELACSRKFGYVDEETFRFWQPVNSSSLQALLRAELSHDPVETRERKIEKAMTLYADYGRGNDGMQMPWVTRCFKATVRDRIWGAPPEVEGAEKDVKPGDPSQPEPVLDDATLLIDFR